MATESTSFREYLVAFLEGELALYGEKEFLLKLGYRFLGVSKKTVIIHASFLDWCH